MEPKDLILTRVQAVENEINAMTNEYKNLANYVKELENRILLAKGQQKELGILLEEVSKNE